MQTETKTSRLLQILLFFWTITALAVWFWNLTLVVVYEEQQVFDTNIGRTSAGFNNTTKKIEDAGPIHKFFWTYYAPSEEYDYSSDRFGDRKPLSPGFFWTLLTWVVAVILFTVSSALDSRRTLLEKILFWICILILFGINVIKAEFLWWVSH